MEELNYTIKDYSWSDALKVIFSRTQPSYMDKDGYLTYLSFDASGPITLHLLKDSLFKPRVLRVMLIS